MPNTNLALRSRHKENLRMSEFQQNVRRNVYTHHVFFDDLLELLFGNWSREGYVCCAK